MLAASGIWDDSLNILAELRLKNSQDAELKSDWQTLLESVDLINCLYVLFSGSP
ncbi:DUF928 domain-containing protein [Nostoc sp. CHAB 5844]|nr:DUF928 domain-containing protein [Nostoc sp. CHAB 5844]